jgi:UDP-2-acetamido-3-amino-2,3-dideoxy-glucuronate N-acetyltransferase
MDVRLHPTALVEDGVSIGDGTSVWDNAHLRTGAIVGRECIVGEKTYLAPDVRVGDRVKLNAMVYLCTGVTLGDGVMVGAATTFTNDRFPRATTPDLGALRPSEADEHTLDTVVGEGASIGAGSTIGPGIEIGRFAMVGMGSVVTKSVPPFALVYGNPARQHGWVCRCGEPLDGSTCDACGRPSEVGEHRGTP